MKKLSWGTNIAIVYTLFALGIIALVFVFMGQDVGLVTNDYYAKEIRYQDQIDKMNRTKALPKQLDISIEPVTLKFVFPKIFKADEYEGKIKLYRPSDKTKDFTVNISPDSTRTQYIRTDNLAKGLWKVQVDWIAKGNSYFNEKIIMVN